MTEVNEIVRYGAQGICRIQQIEEKSIGASRRLYYVLKPVYHEGSTIFVPVDNPALTGKMHRLLRAQEVLQLLSGLAGDDGLWVEDEAQRREAYEQILRSGDRVGMARSSARCPCKRSGSARSARSCTPPRRPSSRRRSAS